MLRESITESEVEYNPNRYVQDSPDTEAWGDLQSEFQYKEEIVERVVNKVNLEVKVETEPKVGKIAQKYFNIRPKTEVQQVKENPKDVLKDLIENKIEELNFEIQKFKKDSDQLKRAKILYEEKQNLYQKELQDFEKIKETYRAEVEKAEEIENLKLKQELKVYERNQKVLSAFPSKKERDEIDNLTHVLNKCQEELKMKNMRYKMNKERMIKQVDEAKKRQLELQDQVKKMLMLKEESMNESNPQETIVARPGVFSNKSDVKSSLETSCKTLENTAPQYDKQFFQDHAPNPGEQISAPEYSESIPVMSQQTSPDGKILKNYESGHKEILFPNGMRKEIYSNGYSVIFHNNNDVKQVFPDGKTVYFYAESNTTHTIYKTGLEVIKFENGQVEKHYPDGNKKIVYVDGTIKKIDSHGDEEIVYPDSTKEIITSGQRIIVHPGGHQEVQTVDGKKYREYHDGRIIYI